MDGGKLTLVGECHTGIPPWLGRQGKMGAVVRRILP